MAENLGRLGPKLHRLGLQYKRARVSKAQLNGAILKHVAVEDLVNAQLLDNLAFLAAQTNKHDAIEEAKEERLRIAGSKGTVVNVHIASQLSEHSLQEHCSVGLAYVVQGRDTRDRVDKPRVSRASYNI
jgi:hypothetical protein